MVSIFTLMTNISYQLVIITVSHATTNSQQSSLLSQRMQYPSTNFLFLNVANSYYYPFLYNNIAYTTLLLTTCLFILIWHSEIACNYILNPIRFLYVTFSGCLTYLGIYTMRIKIIFILLLLALHTHCNCHKMFYISTRNKVCLCQVWLLYFH